MRVIASLIFGLLMLGFAAPAAQAAPVVQLAPLAQAAPAEEGHFPLYGIRGNSGANLDK